MIERNILLPRSLMDSVRAWRGLGWGEVIPLPLVLLTLHMWCSVTQDQGLIRFGFQQTDKERFWACPNVTVEVIFREPVRAGDLAFCSKLHISERLTFLILVIDSATSAEGIIPTSPWTGLLHLALQRAKEISCLILQKLFIFTGEKWLRQSDERRIVNFCGFFSVRKSIPVSLLHRTKMYVWVSLSHLCTRATPKPKVSRLTVFEVAWVEKTPIIFCWCGGRLWHKVTVLMFDGCCLAF